MKKKLLALVTVVGKWRHYLEGHHFIIKTDHQSLKHLLEQRITTPLQQKWLTKLLGLSYEIQYKKEVDNKVADALSRREGQDIECWAITTVTQVWIQEVISNYQSDEEARSKITALLLNVQAEPGYT